MERRTQKGLEQVAAFAEGRGKGFRTTRILTITAVDVRGIRKKTGLTQEQFSEIYMIPLPTLQGWEQGYRGRKRPRATAIMLLKLIEADPNGMAKRMARIK